MKVNQAARELLDSYLLAVKRELSGKDREDITKEIESHIFDTLEERFSGEGEITVDNMEALFTEMGAPRKVAWQYRPQRSLIGPRLLPIYMLVAKILVAVVVGAILLSSVISTVVGGAQGFWQVLGNFLGSAWSGALSAFAVVTLIFAGIEYATEDKSWEDFKDFEELKEMNEYKASELPQLPEKEKKFSRGEAIFEIIFGVIGLAFLTYLQSSSGTLPMRSNPASAIRHVQVFTANYLPLIPFAIAITGLELARSITMLVQGHNSSLTNWWHIAMQAANVIMTGFVLKAMPIITLVGLEAVMPSADVAKLTKLANTGITVLLWIAIVGTTIDTAVKIFREIKNPSY